MMFRFILILSSYFCIQAESVAQVTHYETNNFAKIASIYHQQATNPEKTLLVFDIDNTLLTMTQSLGGVGWWDWQYDLLKNHPDSNQLLAKNFDELEKIQGLLFQLIKVEPTDPVVKLFLINASNEGSSLLAITARGSLFSNITLNQLQENHFIDGNQKPLFSSKGLKLNNHKTSAAGPLKCAALTQDLSYQQGILYLNGTNKGQALQCILRHAETTYHSILFVDDSARNVDAVEKAFSSQTHLQLITILFNREHAKEAAFLANPKQQNQTVQQWRAIKKTLHQMIEQPNY